MKKILCALLALTLALPCFACAEEAPTWEVKYYLDEFQEPTGDPYIVGGPFYGNFSNSATTNSNLKAYVFYDGAYTSIRLFEYGRYQVSNSFSSDKGYIISIRATVYNPPMADYTYIHDFHTKGTAFSKSTDVYIYSRDMESSEFFWEDFSMNLIDVNISDYEYSTVDQVLGRSSKILFSIREEDGLSSYLFTIDDARPFCELAKETFGREYFADAPTTSADASTDTPADDSDNPFLLTQEEIAALEAAGIAVPVTEEEYLNLIAAGYLTFREEAVDSDAGTAPSAMDFTGAWHGVSDNSIQLNVNADGSFDLQLNNLTYSGTWESDGTTLMLTQNGVTIQGTYDGTSLTISIGLGSFSLTQ